MSGARGRSDLVLDSSTKPLDQIGNLTLRYIRIRSFVTPLDPTHAATFLPVFIRFSEVPPPPNPTNPSQFDHLLRPGAWLKDDLGAVKDNITVSVQLAAGTPVGGYSPGGVAWVVIDYDVDPIGDGFPSQLQPGYVGQLTNVSVGTGPTILANGDGGLRDRKAIRVHNPSTSSQSVYVAPVHGSAIVGAEVKAGTPIAGDTQGVEIPPGGDRSYMLGPENYLLGAVSSGTLVVQVEELA